MKQKSKKITLNKKYYKRHKKLNKIMETEPSLDLNLIQTNSQTSVKPHQSHDNVKKCEQCDSHNV